MVVMSFQFGRAGNLILDLFPVFGSPTGFSSLEVTNSTNKRVCFYVSTAAATPLPDGPDGPNVAVAACAAIGLKLAPVKDGLEKAALNNLMSKPLLFNQYLLFG